MKHLSTIQELKNCMIWHVKREVGHYQTDFYNYDVPMLQHMEYGQYIWITRECGTHLTRIDGRDRDLQDRLFSIDYVRAVIDVHGSDAVNVYVITCGPGGFTFEKLNAAKTLQDMTRLYKELQTAA